MVWRALLRLQGTEGDGCMWCTTQLGIFECAEGHLHWAFLVSAVRGPRLPVLHLSDFTSVSIPVVILGMCVNPTLSIYGS